ncbi:MAG: pitrilysin family protein [Bryobacterales bacterium]|nr:pitrilysin family protein [Bryobacterales bacterium]MDE0294719.1 pitrilysin family protein [Bryobacterales bacterium]
MRVSAGRLREALQGGPMTVLVLIIALLSSPALIHAQEIDIPYEKFVLDNGLTLIVHEDRKTPVVAVNVWYHVGSKNEKPGKTGFAHLFEHLMFNGTENFNDDYFKALDKVGATDVNGTTNADRTNYFQNVPTPALDFVLWLESDRMGHMLGAVNQERLDEQRGVVQNEKRQGENQPYGVTRQLITENTYPAGHPYSWTTIGSMEDLDAASLEDVHEWFKKYYGPSNAVIAIAGDIDPQTAKTKAEKYFGDIPGGEPVAKHRAWIAKRRGFHRQTVQDRVPQARIYKVWNIPEMGSSELQTLDLTTDVLGYGKNSRLYRRLVYQDQIATNVSAYIYPREIGSQLHIVATAHPDADLTDVEKALDEELARFLEEGPTEAELSRIKTQFRARFIRGIERIGGFGGKSDILAQNEVYAGTPDFYKTTLQWVAGETVENMRSVAQEWLSDGVYILEVHPFPKLTHKPEGVDRSKLPDVSGFPDLKLPAMQKAELSNGLKVVLAERPQLPVVEVNLMVDAGYASDQFAAPGVASMTADMLDEGTKSRNALEISEALEALGASLGARAGLDTSTVSLSALKENLDASLDLFMDVILNPTFPEKDFQRLKRQRLARIQQEKSSPVATALRLLPGLIYGNDHAYGNPLTGSGTEESVKAMKREDLVEAYQQWFQPKNSTIIVVGSTTMDEILPNLQSRFASWKDTVASPNKALGQGASVETSRLYLVDKPGALQSFILAGVTAPPTNNPEEIAIDTMNSVLGGNFTSRINMNLREDKHWSYGARSMLMDARGPRLFFAYASVQTDKTKESVQELQRELTDILHDRPPTEEELMRYQHLQTTRLPGRFETNRSLMSALREIINFGLPEDYYDTYAGKLAGLELDDIKAAAERVVKPNRMTWIVIGDLAKVEEGLRQLQFDQVQKMNTDGEVLEERTAKPGKTQQRGAR